MSRVPGVSWVYLICALVWTGFILFKGYNPWMLFAVSVNYLCAFASLARRLPKA